MEWGWSRQDGKGAATGGVSGKEPACKCKRHKRGGFDLPREDLLEEELASHSNILAWRIP